MILHGKAKELFISFMCDKHPDFRWFEYETLLISCQNALIIEWLDSVGITVDVMPILDEKVKFQPNTFWLEKDFVTEEIEYYDCRNQASTEAIKKAVELINKEL